MPRCGWIFESGGMVAMLSWVDRTWGRCGSFKTVLSLLEQLCRPGESGVSSSEGGTTFNSHFYGFKLVQYIGLFLLRAIFPLDACRCTSVFLTPAYCPM